MGEIDTQNKRRQISKKDKSLYYNEDQRFLHDVLEDDLSHLVSYEVLFFLRNLILKLSALLYSAISSTETRRR